MKEIELVVSPNEGKNLAVIYESESDGKRKKAPLDTAIRDIGSLSTTRKGSQSLDTASLKIVPLSMLSMVASALGIPAPEIQSFVDELKKEAEEKGEALPKYVALFKPPSSFTYRLVKIRDVRTPFVSIEEEQEGAKYGEKKQLKAYETPQKFMEDIFRSAGYAIAEAYLAFVLRSFERRIKESKLMSLIVDAGEQSEERGIFSQPLQSRASASGKLKMEEFMEALAGINDIEEFIESCRRDLSLTLRAGNKELVMTSDDMPGYDDAQKRERFMSLLNVLKGWWERAKLYSEYKRQLYEKEGSPYDFIRALIEDENFSALLPPYAQKYPQLGVVDFQAGSGQHLIALNEKLHAGATLFGVEYRDIPPAGRIGGDKNRVRYGVDFLVFQPFWMAKIPKSGTDNNVKSMIYYLNPPYMTDRTISFRSITSIPFGSMSLGLFSARDEKPLRSNFVGFLFKIPQRLTGYEDPETPQHFLALLGTRVSSGQGDPVFIDVEKIEKQEGIKFERFEDVVRYAIEKYPEAWEHVVDSAQNMVRLLNDASLLEPRVNKVDSLFGSIVHEIQSANIEAWKERFRDKETSLQTLVSILSIEANAERGEKVFPDLRVVGTTKLLSIQEVLTNLHLLTFYRDVYPEWFNLAKRVADKLGLDFPDVGSTEEKEVVVSEHLGILRYKYLPKVIELTEEVKDILRELVVPTSTLISTASLSGDEGEEEIVSKLFDKMPSSISEKIAKLERLLREGSRVVIKTKMVSHMGDGDVSFGHSPVAVVMDEYGRDLGEVHISLAEFYDKLEERGIVNPRDRYEVAQPDAELMSKLVSRYVEHVRWIAREQLGVDEGKEEKLKELARKHRSLRDFRKEALSLLSDGEDFRFRVLSTFKSEVLEIADVRNELLGSVSSLLQSMGKKDLINVIAPVLAEIAKYYGKYPFIFLSTRHPVDIEAYRERLTEEERETFEELPWVQDGKGSEQWVEELIERKLLQKGAVVQKDIVTDIKDTIFQTLSEHFALEEGVRQGTERFLTQYLFSFYLEPLVQAYKQGNARAGEALVKMMRRLFVDALGVMPHQYDEAINLLAKKVRTGEKGHLLGWEMRSGKTLAMALMGYFSSLYFGKDTYMFPKTANMLDIIYQIATFTPQVAFNIKAYKSGDVEVGLVADRVYEIMSDNVYPNIFGVRHMNKLLVGGGKTAEELLETYGKDMEELIALYSGKSSEELEKAISSRLGEGKPYYEILTLPGFSPEVRLALYTYFLRLENTGKLADLEKNASKKALDALLKSLANLGNKIERFRGDTKPFFTFHVVPKYHLFSVQYRIPEGSKDFLVKESVANASIEVNRDVDFLVEDDLSHEEFVERVAEALVERSRCVETLGNKGAILLKDALGAVKQYLKGEEGYGNFALGEYGDGGRFITSEDIEVFAEGMIVEPARDALGALYMHATEYTDEELRAEYGIAQEDVEAFRRLVLFLIEEGGNLYEFLGRGLVIRTDEIGSIVGLKEGASHPLVTNYIGFEFTEEVEEFLAEHLKDVSIPEPIRALVRGQIEKSMAEAFRSVLREMRDSGLPPSDAVLNVCSRHFTVSHLRYLCSTIMDGKSIVDREEAISLPTKMKSLYKTFSSLVGINEDSIEIRLNTEFVFGDAGAIPLPSVRKEKDEEGREKIEGRVLLYRPHRRNLLPNGKMRYIGVHMGKEDSLSLAVRGKSRPILEYSLRFSPHRQDIPFIEKMSSSNATNYFIHSSFFKDLKPIAIIDEADESTNPSAKGYLAFYYISNASMLSIASTGTPTSGDVKTPIALIGLVSGLPLQTIERSVVQAVENFAVYTVKEDKVVPFVILQILLQAPMSELGSDAVRLLMSDLLVPAMSGKLSESDIVQGLVYLLRKANTDVNGNIINPNLDYLAERIEAGDIPKYKVAGDLERIAHSLSSFTKKNHNKPLEDFVSLEEFRDVYILFLKERKIATIEPGTYDPIGFVSMLSNSSLLTRETLKQAINPFIREEKHYEDLESFMSMLSAYASGEMEGKFGTDEDLDAYCLDPQLRRKWDLEIAQKRRAMVLSEVFAFYMNNLSAFVKAIQENPEPFLKKYGRESTEEENKPPERKGTDILRLEDEQDREVIELSIHRWIEDVSGGDKVQAEKYRKNLQQALRKALSFKEDKGVIGLSFFVAETGDGKMPIVNLHLHIGKPDVERIHTCIALNLAEPSFTEAGTIPSPNSDLNVARSYVSAKELRSMNGDRIEIPARTDRELKTLMEKSSKTKSDGVLDILRAYIVNDFSWSLIEDDFDPDKVKVAKAVMREFTRRFLGNLQEIEMQKRKWEAKQEQAKRNRWARADGEEDIVPGVATESFVADMGDGYRMTPYLPPSLFSNSSNVTIERVLPNGRLVLGVEIEDEEGKTTRESMPVEFSEPIVFHREEWSLLEDPNKEVSFHIPYRVKYIVDEENELIDMFTNMGLKMRIDELIQARKNFLVAPSRKKTLAFAILDTLTSLFLHQHNRKQAGKDIPTYHVLIRITDKEHADLLEKIDKKKLEEYGIIIKTYTHHTELDAEAKKLKGVLTKERREGRENTKMIVIASAKTVSRGVDFSMLDEMIVAGTLDGNGRDFAQLLARLFNNKDKHKAHISMFGTPIRLKRSGQGAPRLAVNYSSLVQLKLLKKEEFIRAVMSGKIANILNVGSKGSVNVYEKEAEGKGILSEQDLKPVARLCSLYFERRKQQDTSKSKPEAKEKEERNLPQRGIAV